MLSGLQGAWGPRSVHRQAGSVDGPSGWLSHSARLVGNSESPCREDDAAAQLVSGSAFKKRVQSSCGAIPAPALATLHGFDPPPRACALTALGV